MNTGLDEEREAPLDRLARVLWSYPEWWVLALCVMAWVPMLEHGVRHWGHRMPPAPLLSELQSWLLMAAAMMVPLVVDPLRTAAFKSLRSRRHRAMAAFLFGYLGVWLFAGLPVVWLRSQPWAQQRVGVAAAFVLAAVWTLTAFRERALIVSHRRVPLSASGWRADRDCLRFGWSVGFGCTIACWPLMLACTLSGHWLVAMIGAAAIGMLERRVVGFSVWLTAASNVALAVGYLAFTA